MVCGVDDEKLTREAQLEFYDTDVGKLASGVRFLCFLGFGSSVLRFKILEFRFV